MTGDLSTAYLIYCLRAAVIIFVIILYL